MIDDVLIEIRCCQWLRDLGLIVSASFKGITTDKHLFYWQAHNCNLMYAPSLSHCALRSHSFLMAVFAFLACDDFSF